MLFGNFSKVSLCCMYCYFPFRFLLRQAKGTKKKKRNNKDDGFSVLFFVIKLIPWYTTKFSLPICTRTSLYYICGCSPFCVPSFGVYASFIVFTLIDVSIDQTNQF